MNRYNSIVHDIRQQVNAAVAALRRQARADIEQIRTKLDADIADAHQRGKMMMDQALAEWRASRNRGSAPVRDLSDDIDVPDEDAMPDEAEDIGASVFSSIGKPKA